MHRSSRLLLLKASRSFSTGSLPFSANHCKRPSTRAFSKATSPAFQAFFHMSARVSRDEDGETVVRMQQTAGGLEGQGQEIELTTPAVDILTGEMKMRTDIDVSR